MTEPDFTTNDWAGWEQIWRSGDIPPRYRTSAPPNQSVVEWAESIPPGGRVLDLGCGVGRHVVYLGERGFQMAGIDVSPAGVRITHEACAERGFPFDGRVSTMNRIDWPEQTFDAALSTATIHHQLRAGIVETLAEIYRVLRPGGTLLVDFPHKDTLHYLEMRRLTDAGKITEIEPDTFRDESPVPDPSDDLFLPHHFCDESDVRDLLGRFEIIRLTAELHQTTSEQGAGLVGGRWVAWASKPTSG